MWVRELDEHDNAIWDLLVSESPQGNVFLCAEWLALLCATDPDLHARRFGCFEDARLLAGQAVITHRRWGVWLTPPFEFFYCGPLLAPELPATLQVQAHANLAREIARHFAFVAFETHPSLRDARGWLEAGWDVHAVYTHRWQMRDPAAVWQAMNREKRRAIKHARAQFAFSHDESDATLAEFLPLYHQTMRKFSWHPSPKWEAIFRARFRWMAARGSCRLHTARLPNGELVGGVVTLISPPDRTAYLFRQGSNPALLDTGLIPALYWHAANDLAGEIEFVNFGGSPQPSLSRFKDFLGAEAMLHFHIARVNDPARWRMYTTALAAKNAAYNFLMRFARRPLQSLWHRNYAHA